MLIIARIDFISEICLIHSHAANGLLESRSRTKSHCPALHKHARTHTHANTHTDLPISLISTVPAARVPSVQDTDLKGHSVSPLSPEKCQLANPARLSPDCLSEQSAPVWLLKTSKKKIIQTEVNTSLTKLLFMSRLSLFEIAWLSKLNWSKWKALLTQLFYYLTLLTEVDAWVTHKKLSCLTLTHARLF